MRSTAAPQLPSQRQSMHTPGLEQAPHLDRLSEKNQRCDCSGDKGRSWLKLDLGFCFRNDNPVNSDYGGN
jgi:hypothetical protein